MIRHDGSAKNGLADTARPRETARMRTYGQYCPIARAAEILSERWTPIILRNLLLGATTFGQIADGAPGISRTLLAYRLKELEQAGVITSTGRARGHGRTYALTRAGSDLNGVMLAMGTWGERWLELGPPHLDPGVVLDFMDPLVPGPREPPGPTGCCSLRPPGSAAQGRSAVDHLRRRPERGLPNEPWLRRGPDRPGVIERTCGVASRADHMG